MKHIVWWMAAAFLLLSCGGKDSGAKSHFSETCTGPEDCISGLSCINGLCTLQCSDATACQTLKVGTVCSSNACYIPCTDAAMCPGVPCVMDAFTQAGMGVCKPNQTQ